jgi:hypothetical protein
MCSKATLHSAGVIPKYQYWPVLDATSNQDIKPTEFADDGNLDNFLDLYRTT